MPDSNIVRCRLIGIFSCNATLQRSKFYHHLPWYSMAAPDSGLVTGIVNPPPDICKEQHRQQLTMLMPELICRDHALIVCLC